MTKENEEVEKTEVEKTEVQKVEDNFNLLKEANDKVEAELLRKEELRAKMQMGGNSEAGQTPVEKPKETDEEFTERFERGEINLLE